MAKGTMLFVKNSKAELMVKGISHFLFFEAYIPKRRVNKKNIVKILSRLPERVLKTNQIAEDSAIAEHKPTKGLNNFFPNR